MYTCNEEDKIQVNSAEQGHLEEDVELARHV